MNNENLLVPPPEEPDKPLEKPNETFLQKTENSYKKLLRHAEDVGGMPFETPIRKADVHGWNPVRGPGDIVSQYIMVGFEDRRHLTIYRDFTADGIYKNEWLITIKIPDDENVLWETKCRYFNDGKHRTDIHEVDEKGHYLEGYRESNVTDLELIASLMDEAVQTAPERQKKFLEDLNAKKRKRK